MKLTFYEQTPEESEEAAASLNENNQFASYGADIPATDSPTQVTLEGISGMVVMNTKTSKNAENSNEDEED